MWIPLVLLIAAAKFHILLASSTYVDFWICISYRLEGYIHMRSPLKTIGPFPCRALPASPRPPWHGCLGYSLQWLTDHLYVITHAPYRNDYILYINLHTQANLIESDRICIHAHIWTCNSIMSIHIYLQYPYIHTYRHRLNSHRLVTCPSLLTFVRPWGVGRIVAMSVHWSQGA